MGTLIIWAEYDSFSFQCHPNAYLSEVSMGFALILAVLILQK